MQPKKLVLSIAWSPRRFSSSPEHRTRADAGAARDRPAITPKLHGNPPVAVAHARPGDHFDALLELDLVATARLVAVARSLDLQHLARMRAPQHLDHAPRAARAALSALRAPLKRIVANLISARRCCRTSSSSEAWPPAGTGRYGSQDVEGQHALACAIGTTP